MAAQIQFVSDTKGRPVSVIVPIALWQRLATDGGDRLSAAQRRTIDAEIAKARRGPHHGPFAVDDAVNFLKREIKDRRSRTK